MATFIECVRYDGRDFVAIRASAIQSVNPVFNSDGSDEFMYTQIILDNGTRWQVNEVWEQIEFAMNADGFSVVTPTLAAVFG